MIPANMIHSYILNIKVDMTKIKEIKMKGRLKEVRKEAREYMNERGRYHSCISFTRQKGYYFTPHGDGFTVFYCNKNGSLTESKTDYARRFHQCKKQREKRRNQNCKNKH